MFDQTLFNYALALWVTMDQRVHNIVLNEFLSAG